MTLGGATGFIFSWLSAGAALIRPPLLLITFILRSATQQILNERDYRKLKKILLKMFEDEDIKNTLNVSFGDGPDSVPSSPRIEMGSSDSDPNFTINYGEKSSQEFDKSIKREIEERFGIVENPTDSKLKEIREKNINRGSKGKTVYFRDFINERPDNEVEILDSNIIEAEIIEKTNRIREDGEF